MKPSFSLFFSLVSCFAFIISQFFTLTDNKFITHILFLIWIISIFIVSVTRIPKRYLFLISFALFYFFSSSIAVGIETSFNRTIALFETLSPIIMFDVYNKYNIKTKKVIAFSFLILLIISAIQMNHILLTSDVGLRLLQGEVESSIGDKLFHLSYGFVFTAIAFAYIIFRCKDILITNKQLVIIMSLLSFAICEYLVIRSLFATAIFSSLFGLLISYMSNKSRWVIKLVIGTCICCFLFVLLGNIISQYIADTIPGGTVLSQRIEEVTHVFSGNSESAIDFSARSDLSSSSIRTFLQNPIFGINHSISNFETVKYSLIGNHSEWIDSLALYGSFAILLFSFFLSSMLNISQYAEIKSIFIIYVFIGFLNPINYFIQNSIAFFFIPILFEVLLTKIQPIYHNYMSEYKQIY